MFSAQVLTKQTRTLQPGKDMAELGGHGINA